MSVSIMSLIASKSDCVYALIVKCVLVAVMPPPSRSGKAVAAAAPAGLTGTDPGGSWSTGTHPDKKRHTVVIARPQRGRGDLRRLRLPRRFAPRNEFQKLPF